MSSVIQVGGLHHCSSYLWVCSQSRARVSGSSGVEPQKGGVGPTPLCSQVKGGLCVSLCVEGDVLAPAKVGGGGEAWLSREAGLGRKSKEKSSRIAELGQNVPKAILFRLLFLLFLFFFQASLASREALLGG